MTVGRRDLDEPVERRIHRRAPHDAPGDRIKCEMQKDRGQSKNRVEPKSRSPYERIHQHPQTCPEKRDMHPIAMMVELAVIDEVEPDQI